MGNCLVSKLKDSISDINCLKLGEVRFNCFNSTGYLLLTYSDRAQHDIRVLKGTVTSNTISSGNQIIVAEAGTIIAVSDKYMIASITAVSWTTDDISDLSYRNDYAAVGNILFNNLDSTKYIPEEYEQSGDADTIFSKFTNIKRYGFGNQNISGNIGSIVSTTLEELELRVNTGIKGTLNSIQNAPFKTTLKYISLIGTSVTGNINVLAGFSSLTTIGVSDAITGNVESLAGLSGLKTIEGYSTALTGDLSRMPADFQKVFFSNGATFTWETTRPSSSSIFSIARFSNGLGGAINMGEYLEDMLSNLASCAAPEVATVINVTGVDTGNVATLAAALKQHAGANLTRLVVNNIVY